MFDTQRDQILQHLDASKIGTKQLKDGRPVTYRRKDWLDDLADWIGTADNFRQALQPIIYTVLNVTGQDAFDEIGLQPQLYDPYTPAIEDYFATRSQLVADGITDETQKQVRAALGSAVSDGMSTSEMAAMVEDIMGVASSMRADRIARTETANAQGYADIEAWGQSGIVAGKEWFTAEDEHVCPFCDDLDHQVFGLDENIFDKGDTHTVGDQSQAHNYDDVQNPPLHPNCRCCLLPVLA